MDYKSMNEQILKDPKRRKEIAFHETAHFITYIAYCYEVMELPHCERLSILAEDSEVLGYFRHRPINIVPMLIPGFEEQSAARIRLQIKQSFAGPACDFILSEEFEFESHFFEDYVWESRLNPFDEDYVWEDQEDLDDPLKYSLHQNDLDNAIKLASIINPDADDEVMYEYLLKCFLEAVEDVRQYWPLISEVGNRLFEAGLIEGEELEQMAEEYLDRLHGGQTPI